jgi:hypothetical protein
LLPSLLGVGGVVGVLMLVYGAFSYTPVEGGSSAGPAVPVATVTTSPPADGTPGVITSTSPVASPGSTPVRTTASPTPTLDPQKVSVEVRNSTSVSGLAGRLSDYLGGLGWAVREPGNYYPPLDQTMVFFPPGLEAGARALAALVPGDDSKQLAPVSGDDLAVDAVTVVVGKDAAGWRPPG